MSEINNQTLPTHHNYYREYRWNLLPETEIDRLQGTLYNHVKKMNKKERTDFVLKKLKEQKYTCAFGINVQGKYCWNAPKDKEKNYLVLQWGHNIPKSRSEEQNVDGLCLMCARCNNHIQSSRLLEEIELELSSKLEHIKLLQNNISNNSSNNQVETKG